MRRLTASLALAAVVSLGGAAGAAQGYTPNPPSWTPPFNLNIGGQVSFDSDGFAPGSHVDFSLVNAEGDTLIKLRLEADANGQVQYEFDANFGGMFAAVAQGQNLAGEPVQASKVINVVEAAEPAVEDDASSDVVADDAVVVEDAAPVDGSAPAAAEGAGSPAAAPAKTVAPVAEPISAGSGEVVSVNSGMPVTKAAVSAGTAQVVKTGGGAAVAGGPQLAKTGTDTLAPMVWAGAGLLAFGAGLVGITVVRRRSNQLT